MIIEAVLGVVGLLFCVTLLIINKQLIESDKYVRQQSARNGYKLRGP